MIVFGHNSFLLHGCKPSELGMPVEIDAQYRVERRQRYFHFFWIPTFGIGKIWALRDLRSNQLYQPNGPILQALNSLPLKDKTPWYTYALPLLALVVAIIAPIYMKIDDYASAKRYEAYTRTQNEALKHAVESPGKYQYFELRDAEYNKSFVKVVGNSPKSLKCLIVTGDYSDPGFLEVFARNKGVLDTIVIDKQMLIQSIGEDNLSNASLVGALPDERPRVMVAKYEYDVALFHTVNAGFEEGNFVASIQNVGADVTLDSVTVKNANLTLTALPEKIALGDEFQLVGSYSGMEPQYSAVWSFKNADGKSISYDVHINSARIYFNKK
jgi:hypothetical protein